MITLVYGGSSSGKSEFAENLVCSSQIQKKYYLATMKYSKDTKERIHRHRVLREGKGFHTLEYAVDISNALKELKEFETTESHASEGKCILLLECMSNLVANEMFIDGEIKSAHQCADKILKEVEALEKQTDLLVIVTNNVFEDGRHYDSQTKEYMKALGMVNRQLAASAESVFEVVVGIGIKQ